MQLPARTNMSASTPHSAIPSFRLIDSQLNQVKELINKQLAAPAKAGNISRLLKYVTAHSGKMIRSGLVLLSYYVVRDVFSSVGTSVSPRKHGHDAQTEVIRIAAIIEMIHNATLLHDDVIDEGQKRRGRPTVNSLWGNESAVLLGDFILSQVFEMCTELEPQVAKVIANAAVRLCTGELRQVAKGQNWQLSEKEYIDIITEKSAILFSSACYLGALSAQARKVQTQALTEFGLNAGIAFQITDDLLDLVGDESKTGKRLGSDVNKHKLTLAVIHLLRSVDEMEKNVLISSYLKGKSAQYDRDTLVKMLDRYGSLEYAHNRAQEFVAAAIRALSESGLKESRAKDALITTAKFMAERAI